MERIVLVAQVAPTRRASLSEDHRLRARRALARSCGLFASARGRAGLALGVVGRPATPGATVGDAYYLPGDLQCIVLVAQLAPTRRAPLSEDHRPRACRALARSRGLGVMNGARLDPIARKAAPFAASASIKSCVTDDRRTRPFEGAPQRWRQPDAEYLDL